VKKNRLNRLKFWKNRPVLFGFCFLSLEPKKPNRTEKNQKKTEPNRKNRAKSEKNRAKPKKRAKPVWTGFCSKKSNRTEPKPVGLNRFRFGFGFFFKKNSVWLLFLIKTEPNRKWIPLDMTIEILALASNDIWSLRPYDSTMNMVGYKWMSKIKHMIDRNLKRYKT